MAEKTNTRLLIFWSLLLILVWGCAQKPGPKPMPVPTPAPEVEAETPPGIPSLIREAEELVSDGSFQDALLVYNQALDEAVRQGPEGQAVEKEILTRIEALLSWIPPESLKRFAGIKNLTIPQALVQYWLGHNYAANKDYPNALLTLEAFISTYPEHPRALDAKALLHTVRMAGVKKDTIGCLLPMSGKYRVYGQKALMGIQLAVQDLTRHHGRQFKVIVKDTRSDPEQAALCVEELARDKVFAIAGPLLVPEAAGAQAQKFGIPMIAMTQKSEFPLQGDYLFSNFITPQMQVEALGSYIFTELGLKKVAILYPNERYGRRHMELFWDVVDRFGGEIVGIEDYDGKKTDFTTPLKKLTGEYYPVPEFLKPPAEEAYPDGPDEMMSPGMSPGEGHTLSKRGSAVANQDRIQIDFEALFIPDGLSRVNLILPQLAFNDARGMVLLGTNLWHRDSLLTQSRGYNKNTVICDGYFGESKNSKTAGFDRDFKSVFQETPGFLEAIAYDTATLLFTAALDAGVESRQDLKNLLQGGMIFNGVTGTTLFDEAGRPHKELFLITVKNGRFREINH